tara:strand:+ start:404 stop:844 length:441 start_codon:yes stop_codon:yes gene_type:complete
MARITTYATDTNISELDKLVGTDADDASKTKNFLISTLADYFVPYQIYAALLTQVGEAAANPPVATILQNNTGATVTWARTSAGIYTATANSNIFTSNKTSVIINQGSGVSTANIKWTSGATNTITIDVGADGVLTGGFIEIRIYA